MKHLLKKELSELLSKQMLIGLVVSLVIMLLLGFVMNGAMSDEITNYGTVHIIDNDRTDFTADVISRIKDKGYEVELGDAFEQMVASADWKNAVEFPAGMSEQLLTEHKAVELRTHTALQTLSTLSMSTLATSNDTVVTDAIREALNADLLDDEYAFLDTPVSYSPTTYANGRSADVDASIVVSSVAMFDTFMPLVLFLLVVLTSQTIIGAIAAEKTDKTLETLLSAPVPRSRIIFAKMLAALIVALIYAVTYGVGFLGFMISMVSGTTDGMQSVQGVDVGQAISTIAEATSAVKTLGLEISGIGWIGVIAQLILTLGISLTASIILGGLVEDAKGSQTAAMPIMLCTMFPYILTMVSDIRHMEMPTRLILYAVPFTHTFIATSCLHFQDYVTFWGGLAYQAVFLAGITAFALKLYSSDMLFVHRSRKSKAKLNAD